MNDQEKKIIKTLADTFDALPDSKKEYLLGFAEGVAAMTEEKKSEGPPSCSWRQRGGTPCLK